MNNAPQSKNVLITGASQGIGKAIAEEYSACGYSLVLLSRNIEAIQKMSDSINSKGGKCFCKQCDVADYNSVKEGIEFAHNSLGTIDIAVLNAGVGNPEWMSSFRSEEFKKVVVTNTFGIAHCLEFLIPVMKKQGYGKIAGVTSLSDVRGYAGSSSYCSSKAAASLLLESARVELKQLNIKVITIRPGFVKTAMTDKNEFKMPFLMSASKAARIIRKGIDKNKSVVQFPFLTVMATRIIKNLPNWLYDWGMRKSREIK
jgi:short-subunit dehydrogenase